MADPISDMFIRIKNAQKAGHESVQIPYSQLRYKIMKVMERAGFIGKVEKKGKRVKRVIEAPLIYKDGAPMVGGVRLLSKPGRRVYVSYRSLKPTIRLGTVILSTSKGVMISKEAQKEKVGGELIAEIW